MNDCTCLCGCLLLSNSGSLTINAFVFLSPLTVYGGGLYGSYGGGYGAYGSPYSSCVQLASFVHSTFLIDVVHFPAFARYGAGAMSPYGAYGAYGAMSPYGFGGPSPFLDASMREMQNVSFLWCSKSSSLAFVDYIADCAQVGGVACF